MNRTCLSCGTPLSDTAKFCKGCGAPVTSEEPAVTASVSEEQVPLEKSRGESQCAECGAVLSPGAKFCRGCGAPVTSEKPIVTASIPAEQIPLKKSRGESQCAKCGAVLSPGAKFCKGCGTSVTPEKGKESIEALGSGGKSESAASIASAAGQAVKTFMASSSPGESLLGVNTSSAALSDAAARISATVPILSPLKVLGNGLITAIKGIKEAGKNKKALGGAIVMAAIWFFLTMLSATGTSVPAWLNFLTFAKGGTTGGISGFVGGILGKGLFASLIVGMMNGAGRPKPAKSSSDSTEKAQSSHGYGLILCGMGLALIIYNFMTGDNSLQNSMAGIVAAASVVRSSKQGGFIRQLMVSLTARFSGKKLPLDGQVKHLTIGFAAGFGLSLPLSFSGSPWVCYLTGLAVFIIGIILCSTVRKQKDISVV